MQALISDNRGSGLIKLRVQFIKKACRLSCSIGLQPIYHELRQVRLKQCTQLLELCWITNERILGDKLFPRFIEQFVTQSSLVIHICSF